MAHSKDLSGRIPFDPNHEFPRSDTFCRLVSVNPHGRESGIGQETDTLISKHEQLSISRNRISIGSPSIGDAHSESYLPRGYDAIPFAEIIPRECNESWFDALPGTPLA